MKQFKRLISVLGLCLIAQTISSQNFYDNHVIVALDARSNLQTNPTVWHDNIGQIGTALPTLLSKIEAESGIISTLTYSLEDFDNDMSKYTHNITTCSEYNISTDFTYWDKLSTISDGGNRYSLLSIAKPYCLKSVMADSNDDDAKLAKRTFLVLITDLHYNGNDDFHDELRHKPGMSKNTLSKILSEVKVVQQNYFYDFISEVNLHRGYMILFECVPQQKYFALESVAEFPHKIIAKRTKNGYNVEFLLNSFNNPNYKLLNTDASIGDMTQNVKGFGSFNFNLQSDKWENSDTIHLRLQSWVRFIDGIYNRTVLSPTGSILQGKDGLNRIVIIQKESDAKILGFISLPDFLYKISFWTSNQSTAAAVWGIIFILIIITLILFGVSKTMKYKPQQGGYKA